MAHWAFNLDGRCRLKCSIRLGKQRPLGMLSEDYSKMKAPAYYFFTQHTPITHYKGNCLDCKFDLNVRYVILSMFG